MRAVKLTQSALGSTSLVVLDTYISPFNIGIGCDVSVGATLTYTVQHTFDDVFNASFDPANATWFSNSTLVSQTADKDGNYAYPVTAIRLTVTAYTSGSVTMTVIQAGAVK